jgi:hypothetical protein
MIRKLKVLLRKPQPYSGIRVWLWRDLYLIRDWRSW